MSTVPANPSLTRRQKITMAALSSMAFLTTYIGLAGPMAALHRTLQGGPWGYCIEVVFFPVVFLLRNRVEPFATLIKAWVSLFV